MQGVGRLADGRAVFVRGALPGETVSINITKDSGRFCEATVQQVIDKSPHRIEPDCPYYGVCGGCQLRHADAELSAEMKRMRISDALQRIGGIENAVVNETLTSQASARYRNKAEYSISNGIVGLRSEIDKRIIPVTDCLLQSKLSIDILNSLRAQINRSHISGWLVTRTNTAGEAMVILSTVSGRAPTWLKSALNISGVKSVYHCALKNRPTHALDGKCELIAGETCITEWLCGLDFSISPQTFFQVNTPQAERLYELALSASGAEEASRVLDAYCGCGTISLAAARMASKVLGVEIVAPAITDAIANARRNGLEHKAEFQCGDAAKVIPARISKGERFDCVIVDPPRKGCDEALLNSLIGAKIPRIAYVSCDPGTLARDMHILTAGGYEIQMTQPVDMFPETAHVETVVLLNCKGIA